MFKELFQKFLDGTLSFSELKNAVEEYLFILRQNPEITKEQQILSRVELLMHEVNEGFREETEVCEYIRLISLPEQATQSLMNPLL